MYKVKINLNYIMNENEFMVAHMDNKSLTETGVVFPKVTGPEVGTHKGRG